jgi:branched-chain amino acid transport system ATP-binding protein
VSSPPLIELRNLEAGYGPVTAIRGVSLQVPRGAIVALLGANGAGKTTVLKVISGILEPLKGSILLAGERIDGLAPAAVVRRGVSHAPEGREIFPLLTVQENLLIGGYTRPSAELKEGLAAAFDYFPALRKQSGDLAGLLSGGQQQMLSIARALMARPSLLLLDEPSLGLSPILTAEIFEIVTRINRESGTTVLMVEQNARVALEAAHYGYVMEVGRIVLGGSSESLRRHPDVAEFYLGVQAEGVRGETRWKRRKTWH